LLEFERWVIREYNISLERIWLIYRKLPLDIGIPPGSRFRTLAIWKNEVPFDNNFLIKKSSGIHDPKSLFSVGPLGPEIKVATDDAMATLDELPCNINHPEALFSVKQIIKKILKLACVLWHYLALTEAYLLILNGFIELVNCMAWGMVWYLSSTPIAVHPTPVVW
jgi:hypothetical protein